ncbi:hypothetical protein AgCh_005074 [Apium graveolens]
MVLGEYIASAPLTPLVKPGGDIHPIAVGTVWRRLVSKVGVVMVGSSLGDYFDGLQFGVGVSGGGEAILHAVNRLIEDRGHVAGVSMLLGVQQGDPLGLLLFTLVLHPLDGPQYGLHLNVVKTEVYWPKDDHRSRLAIVFPPNIARPLQGVKLLGGHVSVDSNFSSELVMKRVAKTICLWMSLSAQFLFDKALRSTLERIFTASGPGVSDWKWRLATLPLSLGGLGPNSASYEWILVDKEVDIGLDGGLDKKLRPVDLLLYSWDMGLDVCVDLTRSSPLTKTGMSDFMAGQAVIDYAQRKCVKY